ncbi:MAG: lysophospholipase [Caldilineaceae bacterium]|nr:lysophospholipase [Caldilineaceae bacterium]MBP8109844.1 lysophospholipase [Caldilineaceae bacterium]MBP8124553.1 lysophospholipase [Caldilineaceae bacterium]MBP9074488.1 lysophospholipase [Caldilineaceae bacterium]
MASTSIPRSIDNPKYALAGLADYHDGTFAGEDGVPIFYRRWLPATAARRGTVVIVHGLGEHGGRYLNLVRRLLAEGYACYAQDHRGFGRSGGKPGHVNHFADYLLDIKRTVALARTEGGAQPLTLYGHSMGGLIAIHYLQQYGATVDLAIIGSPALGVPGGRVGRGLLTLLQVMSRVYPTFTIDNRGSEPVSRDPEIIAEFGTDPLGNRFVTARWATEMMAAQADWPKAIHRITLPILVMQGMQDRLVMPSLTQKFFRHLLAADKTLYLYPDHFHELHNDLDREKPLGDLAAWLNQRVG